MNRIAAWLLATLFSTIATANSDAYIKINLDNSEVFSGDTIVLDVESTGLLDPIDFSVLQQHTTLLRETTGTRIAVIGGKVQEIAIRRMDLLPKQSGVLVIGPLIAGEVVSNSVHINVLDKTRPHWTPSPDDALIKITLSPDHVMVNQQTLFTVELLHRYPINSESIDLPELKGFSKRALIENRRTFSGDNNEWYRTEWQTLIYPRQSGAINIDVIQWSGTMAKSNVERATFTRTTKPLTLQVSSAPTDLTDWWIPSGSVSLSETWSSPPTELRAGDELERTITISASDVLSGQIPTPSVPRSRALKQVLIHTERNETKFNHTVHATAEFTYRVTAQSPIPVFLDTVRVPWWDTENENLREAIIPARRINVGLPSRADVLSKLALEDSSISQLKHHVQSTGMLRLLSYIAGLTATILLLWWSLPPLITATIFRVKLHRHLRMLQHLAHDGNVLKLYQQLNTAHSRTLLQGVEGSLLTQLENLLFCTDSAAARSGDTPPLTKWLQLMKAQALQARSAKKLAAPEILATL